MTPARAKPSRPACHRVTMPPCHCITTSPCHRITTSPCHRSTATPIPETLSLHGASHRPDSERGRICWEPVAGGVPPPRCAPPRPRGPPRVCVGPGRAAGVGLIFSTHLEARTRESRAVCISDPPASGRQGSGAAAPLLLREALLAQVVSGLGAAPADRANNSVSFSFFSVSLFSGASPGGGGRSSWDGLLFCLYFFFPF